MKDFVWLLVFVLDEEPPAVGSWEDDNYPFIQEVGRELVWIDWTGWIGRLVYPHLASQNIHRTESPIRPSIPIRTLQFRSRLLVSLPSIPSPSCRGKLLPKCV
jgi:hypothetical protein